MTSLILFLAFSAVAVGSYLGFEPLRQAMRRHVFRRQEHVARELAEMFIFISVERLQKVKWGTALAFGFLVLLFAWESKPPGPLVAALLASAGGYWAPELGIIIMRRRRRAAFSTQLVDALVLMANGLRSGFTFPQAIDMVIEEMPAPIRQEFQLIREEIRVGVDLEQALDNSVKRTADGDLDLVVSGVRITRHLGGNLAEVFDRIVAMVRDRKLLAGKASALTAEGRMQATVVGLMPYGFGIVLAKINPGMMQLMWQTLPGFIGLLLVVVLDVAGYLWVLKLTKIKY